MAFPDSTTIGEAIIDFLRSSGGSATTAEVQKGVARKLNISEAGQKEKRPYGSNGRSEFVWGLRLRQVRYDLLKAGKLAPSVQRGVWALQSE